MGCGASSESGISDDFSGSDRVPSSYDGRHPTRQTKVAQEEQDEDDDLTLSEQSQPHGQFAMNCADPTGGAFSPYQTLRTRKSRSASAPPGCEPPTATRGRKLEGIDEGTPGSHHHHKSSRAGIGGHRGKGTSGHHHPSSSSTVSTMIASWIDSTLRRQPTGSPNAPPCPLTHHQHHHQQQQQQQNTVDEKKTEHDDPQCSSFPPPPASAQSLVLLIPPILDDFHVTGKERRGRLMTSQSANNTERGGCSSASSPQALLVKISRDFDEEQEQETEQQLPCVPFILDPTTECESRRGDRPPNLSSPSPNLGSVSVSFRSEPGQFERSRLTASTSFRNAKFPMDPSTQQFSTSSRASEAPRSIDAEALCEELAEMHLSASFFDNSSSGLPRHYHQPRRRGSQQQQHQIDNNQKSQSSNKKSATTIMPLERDLFGWDLYDACDHTLLCLVNYQQQEHQNALGSEYSDCGNYNTNNNTNNNTNHTTPTTFNCSFTNSAYSRSSTAFPQTTSIQPFCPCTATPGGVNTTTRLIHNNGSATAYNGSGHDVISSTNNNTKNSRDGGISSNLQQHPYNSYEHLPTSGGGGEGSATGAAGRGWGNFPSSGSFSPMQASVATTALSTPQWHQPGHHQQQHHQVLSRTSSSIPPQQRPRQHLTASHLRTAHLYAVAEEQEG